MGILTTLIIVLTIVFQISCSQLVPPSKKINLDINTSFEAKDLGIVNRTDGLEINLDQMAQPFSVLIFASDTCTTCAREALYWKNTLGARLPTNIYFAHVLIGGNVSDATDWKNYYSINWDVVLEKNDRLYRTFCPAIVTPCFLVINNQTNRLTQTYEILNKEKVEEITGPWTF